MIGLQQPELHRHNGRLLVLPQHRLPVLPLHLPILLLLLGVLTAPFSHGGFGHLLANSLTFLPLSWLVLMRGRRDYLAVWLGVYATAIPVWLLWPTGSHGLSGVVYGLLGYLLLIGWLEKRPLSMLLSGLALVTYAGVLPSLLPIFSPPGVSWIGHVSGFGGGLLAALAMARNPERRSDLSG